MAGRISVPMISICLMTFSRGTPPKSIWAIALVTELFMLIKDSLNNLLWTADIHDIMRVTSLHESSMRKTASVGAFHSFIDMRVVLVKRFLGIVCDKEEAGRCDRKGRWVMAVLSGCFPVSANRTLEVPGMRIR